MAGQATTQLCVRDALLHRVSELPSEVASLIIDRCIGTPKLISYDFDSLPLLCAQYEPELESAALPEHFAEEHKRLLHQKWLRLPKTFSHAFDFTMVHLACLMQRGTFDIGPAIQEYTAQPARLPAAMQHNPVLDLTGLENVKLEVPMEDFFLLFKVAVPPFPAVHHAFYDERLVGAGTLLAHARKLTLVFQNYSNPWYDLQTAQWFEEDEFGNRPCQRENVCMAGLVVDWVLTYAWHHNYLQHISSIVLKGDVQDWVKEKWYRIFAETRLGQEHVVSPEQIVEIERRGERDDFFAGKMWDPANHFPPACDCKLKCSRLHGGAVQPEGPVYSSEWPEEDHQNTSPDASNSWTPDLEWMTLYDPSVWD